MREVVPWIEFLISHNILEADGRATHKSKSFTCYKPFALHVLKRVHSLSFIQIAALGSSRCGDASVQWQILETLNAPYDLGPCETSIRQSCQTVKPCGSKKATNGAPGINSRLRWSCLGPRPRWFAHWAFQNPVPWSPLTLMRCSSHSGRKDARQWKVLISWEILDQHWWLSHIPNKPMALQWTSVPEVFLGTQEQKEIKPRIEH